MNVDAGAPVGDGASQGKEPTLSVVVPVYNEAANLERLYARLAPVLDGTGRPYEVIFVDDGSTDRSLEALRRLHDAHAAIRVISLNRNYGQHAAVFAGLDHARGEVIVTLDADLQNPPEEIPRLLAEVDAGHDVVGGWRRSRRDPLIRRLLSRGMNLLASHMVGVRMRDYGCMLRAYRREVVEGLRGCREISSFVPALANSFARSPIEVPVEHDSRAHGRSNYNPFRLVRLAFDLMTGFSLLPIQVVSLAGIGIALLGVGFGGFLLVRRLFVGPEVEGVFTLFAILFVFVGIQVLALGLIGEYIGRIYLEVRRRPRYVVHAIYDHAVDAPSRSKTQGSASPIHE
jgi:undecaprenyl-phosphate 4-deoxy-4-formamido-L-arabinose transferase